MRKEEWNAHCVKMILENPVYCGRIAYGRRTLEKVKGKRDKQKRIYTDDYIIVDGVHDAIVSEELWYKVREKRKETGKKFNSVYGNERIHLLTGLLKCPVCGGPMYANRHVGRRKTERIKKLDITFVVETSTIEGIFANIKQT